MDFSKVINDLRAEKGELVKKAEQLLAENKLDELKTTNAQIKSVMDKITETENLRKLSADSASGQPGEEGTPGDSVKPFQSLGEQMFAIANAAKLHKADNRLIAVNEAMGVQTGVGADGGFAIQEDFLQPILESAARAGEILSRVDGYTCSSESNSMRMMQVDESDITSSVFGGIQAYWVSEAASVNASKPKFKEVKIDLDKMMAVLYATDEMLQDTSFISGVINQGAALAMNRLLEGSILDGDGVGKPSGILSSGAVVEVPKKSGQTEMLTYDNIVRMYHRILPRNRSNAVWVMHPDMEQELAFLNFPIGQGGVPVYLPPTGAAAAPQCSTLMGRPIISSDHMHELGTRGDIGLFDLHEYMLLRKGTTRADMSIHVEFLTDQNCFRFIYRCGGAPKQNKPVMIKNSKLARSPFVVLGQRNA